jgi:hypothetical protein
MEQMGFIGEWGGQFVVPIPEVKIYSSSVPDRLLVAL